MQQIVSLKSEGLIHIKYPSQANLELANQYLNEINQILNQNEGKFNILTDATNLAELPHGEIKKVFTDGIKAYSHRINKSAIFGFQDTIMSIAAKLIITITGRKNIKLFNTKEEAMKWLLS